MAVNVTITEYAKLGKDGPGNIAPIPQEPAVASAKSSVTTSAQTTLNLQTKFVRIVADADVYVLFGTNPTATANSIRIPSGVVSWHSVYGGAATKVACYDGSS